MKVLKNFIIAFLVGMFVLALLIKRASAKIILTESNIVPIYGYIMIGMADRVNAYASELRSESDRKIYFVVNSPGGFINEAERILDIINKCDNSEIIIIAAQSAAAGITQMANKRVTIVPDGHLMFHHLKRTLNNIPFTVNELKVELANFKLTEKKYLNRVGIRTKNNYKSFSKRFKQHIDWYVYAKEAKRIGAVDKIETVACSNSVKKFSTMKYSGGLSTMTPLCNTKEDL